MDPYKALNAPERKTIALVLIVPASTGAQIYDELRDRFDRERLTFAMELRDVAPEDWPTPSDRAREDRDGG